jgi:hypothetical protein
MAAVLRIAAVLLIAAGSWAVWTEGGELLAWAGLDALDLPGRVVLVFGFLSVCEVALALTPGAGGKSAPLPHPPQPG